MARKSQRLEPAFEPADALIGFAATMPIIQLVHFINNISFLNLVRKEDLPVYNDKTETLNSFKFYHYQDDDYRSDFCLVANNSSGIIMLPSHRQFSYFMIIHGAIPDGKVSQLISQFKSISGVQLAAMIKPESVKDLGLVLQDLEFHLTELKKKRNENQKRIMPSAEDQ